MRGSEEVSNWMNLFRWIVKLIRDEYGIDEAKLTRTATIEEDLGLTGNFTVVAAGATA